MKSPNNSESTMEDDSEPQQLLTPDSDICQQLLTRYSKSSAAQHRHLCATAAATRSIILSESLPLSPLSYFAATIHAISDTSKKLDAYAIAALSSFLSLVLPLVPAKAIGKDTARDAVEVLVELVGKPSVGGSAPSVRAVVRSVGILLGFCDLEEWKEVILGFEMLVKFSIDRRPKVRKCAQDCVVNVSKVFESSSVKHKASKHVLSLFKSCMKTVGDLSAAKSLNGSKDTLPKAEQLEVLHMLNLLKHLLPYLSAKVKLEALSELLKLVTSRFSTLTRHIFDVMKTMLESIKGDDIVPEVDRLVNLLASYVSRRQNPSDTILSAAYLLKISMNNLHVVESITRNNHLSLVFRSLGGLLTSEGITASHASDYLKELIDLHIDVRNIVTNEGQLVENEDASKVDSSVKSICAVIGNLLSASDEVPSEHILAVVSVLFLKLGDVSHSYMKDITYRLANFMTSACDAEKLQECIGAAVIAMGPEKLLDLLPISLNAEDLTCSNIWLIPILKKYITGASLGFFIEHVVPLAESFARASHKVKKSVFQQDLQAHAHDLWGLLPAFCRNPVNMHKNIKSLVKLLIPFVKEDSFMIENIAISLQELVNQNKGVVLGLDKGPGEFEKHPMMDGAIIPEAKIFGRQPAYSVKTAEKNLRALTSCSEKLLRALTDALFTVPHDKHIHLKVAIGCLASIAESSITEKIFISLLKKLQLADVSGDCEELISHGDDSASKEENALNTTDKDANRCIMLELAYAIAEGANKDIIEQMFNLIKQTFQEADEIGHSEAYLTLNKILEKHPWFCSSRFNELMELLVGLKLPVDLISLRSRFSCYQTLLIYAIKTLDDEDKHTFIILNEIIVTLKNPDEVIRKAAYDIILGVGSDLQCSSSSTPDGPYYKLINMIMGYLSGSSPHIRSGAVSALSVLVHNDVNLCLSVPDLLPSVLELTHSKAIEVIKAVLGFVKVLVLTIQVKDLQTFLAEIVNKVLPWSSVSRHHFRSKVTVILEIMMRKCGSAAVKSLVPDKYKTYLQEVLENRRGKSRESNNADVEPKLSESSVAGQRKRKQDSDNSSKIEYFAERRRQKREGKLKGNANNTYDRRLHAGSGNGATAPLSGKMKIERKNANRRSEAQRHRSTRAKNSSKHGDPSSKRQKR
ncbi:NUC173 domain-containing protein [Heracleum sosnowskyi]|uniref:NUC173 domain-containing protein n=1 Tax=Heracleum sosnowskyi TaxID=360622 RepID=A0AAD8MTQ2_9APIA|nr:NUC173 domain-containing protein [Heracleum sosnowskyi]